MIIAMLREAVQAAEKLHSSPLLRVVLFLQTNGVVVRAYDGQRSYNYIVSWDQLLMSNVNPLLPAIEIVCEAFQEETLNA